MPPSAKQAAPRRALVEGQVRSTAARVFMEKGVATASLGDIAAALGTARTALYHYYRSKDDLLVALITESAEHARAIVTEAARSGLGPAGRVEQVARGLALFALEQPERVRLLDVAAELPPAADRATRRLNRRFFSDLEALITDAVAARELRDVHVGVAAHAIVGATRSLAWWFHDDGALTRADVAEQVAGWSVDGLRINAAARPSRELTAAVTQLRGAALRVTDLLGAAATEH